MPDATENLVLIFIPTLDLIDSQTSKYLTLSTFKVVYTWTKGNFKVLTMRLIKLTKILSVASLLSAGCCQATTEKSGQAPVEARVETLNKQTELLRKRLELLEAELAAQNLLLQTRPKKPNSSDSPNKTASPPKQQSARVYATLRPTLGYIEQASNNNWDIKDALSHAGFKASNLFMADWRAILHGEWGIDLSNNGDLGKARQVYVALDTPYGYVGLGKQRPPQYLFIAEYIDIFDHGNSPFSYDPESIFFVNNLVTYRQKWHAITFMAAGQYDGNRGEPDTDLLNMGLSYDRQGLHAAATYLKATVVENSLDMGDDETWAAALAYEFSNQLYLAVGFQDKRYRRDSAGSLERDGHTFDLSAAFPLSSIYKLKLGIFGFSDGLDKTNSLDFSGYNATIEWLPAPNLRFHFELLTRNFEYREDMLSITVGFRYDFEKSWP